MMYVINKFRLVFINFLLCFTYSLIFLTNYPLVGILFLAYQKFEVRMFSLFFLCFNVDSSFYGQTLIFFQDIMNNLVIPNHA